MKINAITFTESGTAQNKIQEKNKKETKIPHLTTGEVIYAGLSAAGILGLTAVVSAKQGKINTLRRIIQENSNSNKNALDFVETLLPYKIEKLSENKLYKAFSETKDTFMNFLNNTKEDAKNIKNFLFSVKADEKAGQEFVHEMLQDPRKTVENLSLLKNKIGGEKNLLEWLQATNGYNDAYGKYIEKVIENIIYQHLVRMGYDVTVGQLQAGEIDFVCTKKAGMKRVYIQASYVIYDEITRKREFGNLRDINDNYPKYVISMTPLLSQNDDNGITHLHLRKVLMMDSIE